MRLHKLILKDVRNFSEKTEIDFSNTTTINTISGKNGSGKTTIFKCIHICQQAFFAKQFTDRNDINTIIGIELSKLFTNEKAYIQLFFEISKDEKTTLSSFMISPEVFHNDHIIWKLESSESDFNLIKESWNISQPKNLIIYIASDKHFIEENVSHENISIDTNDSYSKLVIDTIIYPEKIFSNIYQRLINDYIRERLVPAKPRKDLYFQVTKILLKYLIPKIELSNFSGLYFQSQFVLLGKASKENKVNFYDIRNFSSGEKTLFYLLLFINYVQQIGMLIIDEPENHFHEDLLIRFTKYLYSSCETSNYVNYIFEIAKEIDFPITDSNKSEYDKFYKNYSLTQVYLLTHSKNLIYNNFSLGANYYIENSLKVIEYDDYERTLRNLGISSVYSKVLFVEGQTESYFLDIFLNDLNIKIHPLSGCEQVIDTFKKLSNIKAYLRESQFCFLIDLDTRSTEEIEKIRNESPKFFDSNFIVLDRHEFENFLLEPKIFQTIIETHKSLLPEIGGIELQKINSIIKDLADKNREHIIRKEIQKLNGYSISRLKDKLRKKEMPVDNLVNYTKYIDNKIRSINISSELLKEFESNYKLCDNRYSKNKWEKDWLSICDGKIVLAETIAYFAKYLGVDTKRFRKEIKNVVLNHPEFEINKIINQIVEKYNCVN